MSIPKAMKLAVTIGLGLVLFSTYGARPLVGEPWEFAV
jgi:hypothetical protein